MYKKGETKVDITGQRFGRLVAIKQDYTSNRGKAHWLFRCDCGTEKVIIAANVRDGRVKSCGCYKREVDKKKAHLVFDRWDTERRNRNRFDVLVKPLFSRYKQTAKKRLRLFDLTLDQFKLLVSSNCSYCGRCPSTRYTQFEYTGEMYYNGVDRVDNALGYTIENCVPCCEACNRAKLEMSKSDFLDLVKSIYSYTFLGVNYYDVEK